MTDLIAAPHRNLILAGFMGTGKSTVGRLCAQRLGLDFVDADEEISRREGMPIPAIFAAHGEGYFRERERALVAELSARRGCVIATGGGMIVDDDNRAALLGSGVGVCLTATPEIILQRVGGEMAAAERPMLRGGDVAGRIARLLRERAPKYAQMHYWVDTSRCAPDDVADLVCDLYRREQARIPVDIPTAGARYDIVIGDGLLDELGFMLAGRGWTPPFAVVSDEIVAARYGERVLRALERAGIAGFLHVMPAGEAHKTLASVEAMYRAFSTYGMERTSAVIALGGGVVGDTAGFAAATFLRGVPLVQVPTSLLAMADSSIGGKVGVDTDFGKNLVGAFKQPDLVVADVGALASLPARELRCGLAEIIKAALLSGGEAYARLRDAATRGALNNAYAPALVGALADAMLLKRMIVQEDPFERGRRALLNLGHTFGHGIEAWSGFRLKHGEAVALGMVCAVRLSRAMGFCDDAMVQEVIGLLRSVGLPTALNDVRDALDGLAFAPDAVWGYMMSDKKKRAGKLRFILLRAPGDAFVCDDADADLAKVMLGRLVEIRD
ncbi:MAG: 3-dehydroquinate synthase [Candidatus Brachytrichaceae bacterium NZ_4S206]|jgi:3-dehydroquinate synthase